MTGVQTCALPIFIENEPCTAIRVILAGVIQVQKIDSLGKTLTIVEFKSGDTLGENLLFGERNVFPMTGLAKTSTVILHIPKEAILALCQKDSIFLTQFLRVISEKTFTLSGKLKEITLKNIRQKICERLFDAYRKENNLEITLNMSKKEWADKIGVQRPSLSRELMKMKQEGLIDYNRNTIQIRNLAEIKKYAVEIQKYL